MIYSAPDSPAAEKQQIPVDWNNTNTYYPRDKTIHQLFEEQVEKIPDNIAVVFENLSLTYRELNERSNQLAHTIRKEYRKCRKTELKGDILIGIYVERSPEMIIGILGILKSGAAYLPLDIDEPDDRLKFKIFDCNCQIVITSADNSNNLLFLSDTDIVLLNINAEQNILQNAPKTNPEHINTSSHLAYVIYTSGSTGEPKGVMIEHRTLVNRLLWMQEEYSFGQNDNVLQKTPYSFDVSVWELMLPGISGAKQVFAKPNGHKDPQYLIDLISNKRITKLHFVPSMLSSFIYSMPDVMDSSSLCSITDIICSGEALSSALAEKTLQKLPHIRLHNLYGPTEATIDASYYQYDVSEKYGLTIPIGKPVQNYTLYVLISNLSQVPIGVSGELYIGGEGLARGYINKADLTAERFISNPFVSDDDKAQGRNLRIYKTGDIVRWLPDGNLEYIGRNDNQIKLRGFRVELGEIENQLSEFYAINQSAVLCREHNKNKYLVGYYTSKQDITADELIAYLSTKLPDYMIPSTFVHLEVMPLTTSGKIDRRALPISEIKADRNKYAAPRSHIEENLCEIWQEVLGIAKIGINDNFFRLGGHSLLATQAVSRIRVIFKQKIPLQVLFEFPTASSMAKHIGRNLKQYDDTQYLSIPQVLRNRTLPLSFAQQRLWFLNVLDPDSSVYNISSVYKLTGAVNRLALENSLKFLVERHESLRTVFSDEDGIPYQLVNSCPDFKLKYVDLKNSPDSIRKDEALSIAKKESLKPFKLSKGPLIRPLILRINESEHLFVLVIHHIISDGWSTGVLFKELSICYNAYIEDKNPKLPDLPIQYADFASWQRNWLQGETLKRQISYWKEQLAGIPPVLDMPTDRPRPAVMTYNGAMETFVFPNALAKALKVFSNNEGVTLFMTLFAAFNVLLYRYTDQDDIVVGAPIANRNREDIEGLIGFFVNTLVMRTDLSENPGFKTLLRRVKKTALDAYSHQDIPFEKLVEELQPERNLSHSPLFQVMFNMLNIPKSNFDFSTFKVEQKLLGTEMSKFELTLSIHETDHELQSVFESWAFQ